jgi:hypothetical protein
MVAYDQLTHKCSIRFGKVVQHMQSVFTSVCAWRTEARYLVVFDLRARASRPQTRRISRAKTEHRSMRPTSSLQHSHLSHPTSLPRAICTLPPATRSAIRRSSSKTPSYFCLILCLCLLRRSAPDRDNERLTTTTTSPAGGWRPTSTDDAARRHSEAAMSDRG